MSLKRVPNLAANRLDEWYTPKKDGKYHAYSDE